jgi:hypothetical protein
MPEGRPRKEIGNPSNGGKVIQVGKIPSSIKYGNTG